MNRLQQKIVSLIRTQGAIDVSQYMQVALADPEYGYYKTAEPFGKDGDFITAPEISQMFGELLGLWALASWQALGSPATFALCEIGGGRGTLMDDVLRTLHKIAPQCLKAAHIVMVETSPRLAAIQQGKLRHHEANITWVENFASLPALPLVLMANELFDALPIHQYIAQGGVLYERLIAADEHGALYFTTGMPTPAGANALPDGTIIELSPARLALADEISTHIRANRGAALIVDYGALAPATGDTLQAMSKHGYCHALENPGQYDLTSHVDFAALARTAQQAGLKTAAMPQGAFLLALGLLERAGQLGANKDEAARAQIIADVERLAGTENRQMGELFKVLCLADQATTMPPFSWET
ncbi:MAG: Methyltransferase [Candidatus Tokpelaia hoelldobleri]|uniref:Methyltransferase n=1 Tax=Candidatus Tokpelaia hoelldobleri TaxID=1902579 RepID=A0A1U9JVH8_9HYPH|nr:MAG: Methyltransferase [Candidatus Tokpelaia hoelldoblerii]